MQSWRGIRGKPGSFQRRADGVTIAAQVCFRDFELMGWVDVALETVTSDTLRSVFLTTLLFLDSLRRTGKG